uniref:Thioredoxin domain-containing protein n=1 Tax=Steinernema glaseri TaxID=37863 RepID=A0A1I7Z417_9BILA
MLRASGPNPFDSFPWLPVKKEEEAFGWVKKEPEEEFGKENAAPFFLEHVKKEEAHPEAEPAFRVELGKSPPLDDVRFGTVDFKWSPQKLVFRHSQKHCFPSVRVDEEGVHFDDQKLATTVAAFAQTPDR